MIKRKQRLDNSRYPEEADKSRDKEKHLPCSNLGSGKMAFGKYNADNEEDDELHQLEKLESLYIVYQFYLSQL